MKRVKTIAFVVFSLVIAALVALPALSILVNISDRRPSREIKMEIVGIGFSKHGLVLGVYSPLCFNDADYSGRFAECATAVYSFRMPLHTSIEYDKDRKVLKILTEGNMPENDAVRMISDYRQLFIKKYFGYNMPDLPQPR
ncbi:MAG: hypothetical protein Q8R55_03335 [Candidatus Taylorbacteria bacterium]|nr:hypothetical protein [Candidatus Taylorbacteria bacterium]